MSLRRLTVASAVAVAVAGCGTPGKPIQTYEQLIQETGRELSTYIGGQVFKIQRPTSSAAR